jgi:hypothetical protein
MRYVAIQALTWGTIAAAICSAVLLAALESPAQHYLAALPLSVSLRLLTDPPQAGRAAPGSLGSAQPYPGPAASAPIAASR